VLQAVPYAEQTPEWRKEMMELHDRFEKVWMFDEGYREFRTQAEAKAAFMGAMLGAALPAAIAAPVATAAEIGVAIGVEKGVEQVVLKMGADEATATTIGTVAGLVTPFGTAGKVGQLAEVGTRGALKVGRELTEAGIDTLRRLEFTAETGVMGSGPFGGVRVGVKPPVTAVEGAATEATVSGGEVTLAIERANTNPYVFDSKLYLRRKDYSFTVAKDVLQSNKVWQRDGIINPSFVDPRTGFANLELMRRGRAPIGPDGFPIELHHTLQTPDCPLAEIISAEHKKFYSQIHINRTTGASSAINRAHHKRFREQYWQERAKDFVE
jgi:hypothetical protein